MDMAEGRRGAEARAPSQEGGRRGRLSAAAIRSRARSSGRYPVGDNLYLSVTEPGRGTWSFRYMRAGRAREMGLGPYPAVPLAEAREKVEIAQRKLRQGIDPLEEKRASQVSVSAAKVAAITFAEVAEQYIASHEAGWRNPKHRQQWRSTMAGYVEPVLGKFPVRAITTDDVLRVLEPIWRAKPETASRVRGRIEAILDYAKVRGWRDGPNPALWRGHLQLMLPAKSKVRQVKHHAALDWREIPAFMAELRQQEGIGALALQFTILTAARSGETRNATWAEIDSAAKVWTIPASRMKSGRQHRIPLSEPALGVLHAVTPFRAANPSMIFPGMKLGAPLSDMSLTAVLRRMGRGDLTAHGFRSSFRDWAAETGQPADIAEAALAHVVGDKTVAAYQRGDLLDRRRRLMAEWAEFCERPASATR